MNLPAVSSQSYRRASAFENFNSAGKPSMNEVYNTVLSEEIEGREST